MTPLKPSYGHPLVEQPDDDAVVWLVWKVRIVDGSVAHDHWHLVTVHASKYEADNDAKVRWIEGDGKHDYCVERRKYGDDLRSEDYWWASGN